MSIVSFIHDSGPGDPPGHAQVLVRFDDTDAVCETYVNAFVQFLRGLTFSDVSIRKHIDSEMA